MHFEGGVCRDEGVTNKWRHKHRVFLKQHDIRLKTVTLEKYVHCKKNIEFATFFILNAKELDTMRLKFLSPPDNITEGFYEHQEEVLQWGNKASRRARLILSGYCRHMNLDLKVHIWTNQCPIMDLPDPLTCGC